MSPAPARSELINIATLLEGISDTAPCGESLKYSLLFDQIKEARREDDSRLSVGIWETTLKRADWLTVESLCLEVLQTKSKDLQCAGWLTECWAHLYGFAGLTNGITLLTQLCEKYWADLYPTLNEDDDLEHRLHVFEWLDTALSQRIVSTVLFTALVDDRKITLNDWIAAKRLESVLKRAPDAKKVLKRAEDEKQLTLATINQTAATAHLEVFEELTLCVNDAVNAIRQLKNVLDHFCNEQAPSFNTILDYLQEIQRFSTTLKVIALKPDQEPTADSESQDSEAPIEFNHPVSNQPPATMTRESAYQQLAQIADFLEKTEPHSPTPHLLRRLGLWKDKSLSDIFSEFGSNSGDLAAIAKLFSKSPTN